jgi:outer membrane receptor protein involved in Fe transport
MPVAVFPNNSGTLTEITFAGNHKNDSEHLLAYELGLRKQTTHAWSVDIAGFLDEHQDLLVAQGAAPVFQTQPVPHLEVINRDINGADVENYGVEISTSAQLLSHWRVSGSYSLLVSNVVNQDPNINFGGTYYEGPQHQFQAHSWVDLTRNLQFNTSFYWVDSAQSGAIPAYGRLDANLTWTPQPGLDVQIGVQNAVNPEHPEFLHRSGPQAEIEAAVYGQITCRF